MQYILIAHDKPDSLALRMATRPAHLDYWNAIADKIVYGGPLLGADGNPFGSVLVVEAESEDAAWAIFEADPYVGAALFEMVTVSAFRTVFGLKV